MLDAFRWVLLEDIGMNLLQSICCLFGNRCIPEEVKQTGGATRPSGPADLGQTEAELERAGKEQMGQMEGGEPSNN